MILKVSSKRTRFSCILCSHGYKIRCLCCHGYNVFVYRDYDGYDDRGPPPGYRGAPYRGRGYAPRGARGAPGYPPDDYRLNISASFDLKIKQFARPYNLYSILA